MAHNTGGDDTADAYTLDPSRLHGLAYASRNMTTGHLHNREDIINGNRESCLFTFKLPDGVQATFENGGCVEIHSNVFVQPSSASFEPHDDDGVGLDGRYVWHRRWYRFTSPRILDVLFEIARHKEPEFRAELNEFLYRLLRERSNFTLSQRDLVSQVLFFKNPIHKALHDIRTASRSSPRASWWAYKEYDS
mgnify:CR=1 FL=1